MVPEAPGGSQRQHLRPGERHGSHCKAPESPLGPEGIALPKSLFSSQNDSESILGPRENPIRHHPILPPAGSRGWGGVGRWPDTACVIRSFRRVWAPVTIHSAGFQGPVYVTEQGTPGIEQTQGNEFREPGR